MQCRLCRDAITTGPRLVVDRAPAGAQLFGTTADEARAQAIALTIVECASCGLVQSASPPVPYHRRAITAAGVSAAMRAHRLAQAERLASRLDRAPVKLALVGCGNGYELPILAEAGFDPVGIESGGAPAGHRGPHPILDAYPTLALPLPPALFGAFACYNFLEHAPDPRDFLAAIRASLTPGAIGVIEVPDHAQQQRTGRVADYVADHLSYFDERTLRAMLVVSGFDVLSLDAVREGENLEAMVQVRPASSLDGAQVVLEAARHAVAGFFARWRAAGVPALTWGASHQALTLLGGIPVEDRPAAIIDSAAFKQGRFAPPAGIPIVAPTREAVAGAGAVLVIASGYEPEIARTLRAQLGFTGEIWTARAQGVERLG